MFAIILGLILLSIAVFVPAGTYPAARRFMPILRVMAIVLMVIGLITSSVKQIDAGFVGVKSLFGKVQPDVLPSGLNFVSPVMDVRSLDVRTQNYTMSGVHDEGTKTGDDAIRVLTADGLEVTIDLSVLYRVIPGEAPRLIREIGENYDDKIVRPIARTRIRDNAVYYDAVSLYSTKRDAFQARIFKSID